MQCSKKTLLFDHLVGALLEKPWDFQAKCLRSLEIDRQCELDRALDGRSLGCVPLRIRSA